MNNAKFDVTAIGNAIVDVIAQADDALLAAHNLPKGAMNPDRRRDGRAAVQHHGTWQRGVRRFGGEHDRRHRRCSGGRRHTSAKWPAISSATIFTHDIRAAGVTYDTPPLVGGLPTARCLIFVTPDAQRTMQTFLGACTQLGPKTSTWITSPRRRWSTWRATSGISRARRRPCSMRPSRLRRAGVKVSLTLSDAFCVARFRDEFLDLAEKYVDILFANESEILSLYQTEDFDDALAAGAEALLRSRR